MTTARHTIPGLPGSWSPEALENMSPEALQGLVCAVDDLLQWVRPSIRPSSPVARMPVARSALFKATREIQQAIQKTLRERHAESGNNHSNEAAEAAIVARQSGESVDLQVAAAMTKLTLGMGQAIPPQTVDEARRLLYTLWSTSKELTSEGFQVAVSFGLVDTQAVAALNSHQVYWINNLFSDHLSTRIRAVARDVLVQQGLSAAEMGEALRTALKRELGVIAGGATDFAPGLTGRYAGNPARYIDEVVHTAAHQARMFSSVQAMVEIDDDGDDTDVNILGYRVENPNDRRTGPICQQLSGQFFALDDGRNLMNRIIQATTPDVVRSIAPWRSADDLANILGDAPPGSDDARQRLVEAGAALPPYHPHCRSTIVVVTA